MKTELGIWRRIKKLEKEYEQTNLNRMTKAPHVHFGPEGGNNPHHESYYEKMREIRTKINELKWVLGVK